MTIKPKKKIAEKSIKSKIKSRRSNPMTPNKEQLEELLDKKVRLSVQYGKNKSGGSIYGILKKLPEQPNMYGVATIENTPYNKEGGYFWFNLKDVLFAGYLFGPMFEITVA